VFGLPGVPLAQLFFQPLNKTGREGSLFGLAIRYSQIRHTIEMRSGQSIVNRSRAAFSAVLLYRRVFR
jgi:hypothetical protein